MPSPRLTGDSTVSGRQTLTVPPTPGRFVAPTLEESSMADESPSLDSLVGSRSRDDNGRFVSVTPTEEKQEPVKAQPVTVEPVKAPETVKTPEPVKPAVAEPVTPPQQENSVPLKALREEREKRQAAEARLRELQNPRTQTDPWSDLPGALSQTQEALRQEMFVERCNVTEEMARDRHKDFDEVREVFLEAANADPTLFARLRNERNPAEFAYREGLRIGKLKTFNGDFSAYEKDIETRTEARVRAELEAKYGKTVVPKSLNSDSSPAVPTEVYEGPAPIGSLLRNASRS